jgi:hypothetical protein
LLLFNAISNSLIVFFAFVIAAFMDVSPALTLYISAAVSKPDFPVSGILVDCLLAQLKNDNSTASLRSFIRLTVLNVWRKVQNGFNFEDDEPH